MREACTHSPEVSGPREVVDTPFDYALLKTRSTRTTHKCSVLAWSEPAPIAYLRERVTSLPSVADSDASFASRSAFNRAIFSSTARRWASYSAQAFVPSRTCSCFRLKLASARVLASLEFDIITSVRIRVVN